MALRTPTPPADNATTHSNGVAVGGRLSVALLEVKRRLETELPGFIAHENAVQNFPSARAIPQFKGYAIAPGDLTKSGYTNMCLVGTPSDPTDFETLGSRAFKGESIVTVYVLDAPLRAETQLLSNQDRANCIRLLLHNYLTDCVDLQGRLAWKTLAPLNERPLPEKFRDYSGVALPYFVVQPAGANLWEVPTGP